MSPNSKFRFGRSKLGGSSATLAAAAIGGGVLLSAVFSALMIWAQQPEQLSVFTAVYFFVTLPIFSVLAWVLLVDRNTIRGAVEKPEYSIESAWYAGATRDTFHVLMMLGGLGCVLFTAWPQVADISVVLLIVLGLMMCTFFLSYTVRKQRSL